MREPRYPALPPWLTETQRQPFSYAVLADCTLLGGYGWDEAAFPPGTPCALQFAEEGLRVHGTSRVFIRSLYRDARALEFSGPGRVTRGGSFFGGGFGLTAAAQGMIAAAVLNTLTSKTTIHTVVRYEAVEMEAFFFYSKATPDDLRIQLSKVLSLIKPAARFNDTDAASQLERLAELHRSSALSNEEFAALKAKIIASL